MLFKRPGKLSEWLKRVLLLFFLLHSANWKTTVYFQFGIWVDWCYFFILKYIYLIIVFHWPQCLLLTLYISWKYRLLIIRICYRISVGQDSATYLETSNEVSSYDMEYIVWGASMFLNSKFQGICRLASETRHEKIDVRFQACQWHIRMTPLTFLACLVNSYISFEPLFRCQFLNGTLLDWLLWC